MKLGVFGGTFNPVHNGHLIAAQEVKEKMSLDRVIFIPSYHPPHKIEKDLAPARHRLNMLKLSIGKNPYFRLSPLEIERGGKSYSIDTMKALKRLYGKNTEFFFILGIDAVSEIFTWKKVNEFLNLCALIAVNRPGFSLRDVSRKLPPIHVASVTSVDVSSSFIRSRIREGKPITYLVPPKVEKYIKRHKLYS